MLYKRPLAYIKEMSKCQSRKKLSEEEAEAEEHEDTNDIQVNSDGSADLSEAEANGVILKDSDVLIS